MDGRSCRNGIEKRDISLYKKGQSHFGFVLYFSHFDLTFSGRKVGLEASWIIKK